MKLNCKFYGRVGTNLITTFAGGIYGYFLEPYNTCIMSTYLNEEYLLKIGKLIGIVGNITFNTIGEGCCEDES